MADQQQQARARDRLRRDGYEVAQFLAPEDEARVLFVKVKVTNEEAQPYTPKRRGATESPGEKVQLSYP